MLYFYTPCACLGPFYSGVRHLRRGSTFRRKLLRRAVYYTFLRMTSVQLGILEGVGKHCGFFVFEFFLFDPPLSSCCAPLGVCCVKGSVAPFPRQRPGRRLCVLTSVLAFKYKFIHSYPPPESNSQLCSYICGWFRGYRGRSYTFNSVHIFKFAFPHPPYHSFSTPSHVPQTPHRASPLPQPFFASMAFWPRRPNGAFFKPSH